MENHGHTTQSGSPRFRDQEVPSIVAWNATDLSITSCIPTPDPAAALAWISIGLNVLGSNLISSIVTPVLPAACSLLTISSTPSTQRCWVSAIFQASAQALIASALTFASSVVNASFTASCVAPSKDHANFVTSAISLLISPKLPFAALTASTADSHWKDTLSPLLKAVSRHDALSVTACSYCPREYSL